MNKTFGTRFQQTVILILVFLIVVMLVFYGYRPTNYNLSVGSVCNRDIYATRDVEDTYQTEYDAVIAKNSVNAIFIRSDELSAQSLQNVENFFLLTRQSRSQLLDDYGMPVDDITPVIEGLNNNLETATGYTFDEDLLKTYLYMTSSAFSFMSDKAMSITEIIMMDNVNTDSLPSQIEGQIQLFTEQNPSYSAYSEPLSVILNTLMLPNSVFDSDATREAGDNAYRNVINDPVVIEKGTKIISDGEVVTEHIYQILTDLELIRENTFDVFILLRVAAYILVIATAMFVYIVSTHKGVFNDMGVTYSLVITFLVPVAASVYLSDMSSLMTVTVFFTAIASAYIGISAGIVLSLGQILMMWPLFSFDPEYLIVSIAAVIVCAAIAGNSTRKYNSASLIIFPVLAAVITSVIYNMLMGVAVMKNMQSAIWTGISVVLSVVLAIGIMPIYELFSRSVSPVKLIELSQPGHPLLKRLFIEASGTYHHSMMVANLADAAAESIGADSLLCKVASYYHDIGKLENPMYFTENQSEGNNPHDDITIEESIKILTAHPEDGVKLGRKSHLPDPILNIINEHHGTTYPGYFYNKAVAQAQQEGLPAPDVDSFRYRGRIPASRESAIVMIADTCEAAIRSMQITDIDEIEKVVRNLIKGKIEQDQLRDSGLSFDDIEKIVKAFRQVYAGVFHSRIKY